MYEYFFYQFGFDEKLPGTIDLKFGIWTIFVREYVKFWEYFT